MKLVSILLGLTGLTACAPENPPPLSGAQNELSRARSTVSHGVLPLGDTAYLTLERQARAHSFELELPAAATVELETHADETGAQVDTVLSLFRAQPSGALKLLARNDDHAGGPFSRIERQLPAGRYLLELRGHSATQRGTFVLGTACSGAGCPVPDPVCLFGAQFSDLRSSARLVVESEVWISAVSQLSDMLARDQLLLAVQQSAHDDVTTPEEALARVDQQEVRVMELRDSATGRLFTVYEYGAGDNSYGAIFSAGTLEIAASIHDGELLDCTLHDG